MSRSKLSGAGTHRSRAIAGIAGGLLLVALAACGDDAGSDEDGGSDSEAVEDDEASEGEASEGEDAGGEAADEFGDDASAETTTTTLDPEEEVLAAYERAIDAMEVAFEESDPENPDLLSTRTGDPLDGAQEGIRARRDQGLGIVGERVGAPEVVFLDDSRAVIRDCWSEELQEIDLDTGENVGSSFVEGDFTEYEMNLLQGDWVVVSAMSLGGECD